MLALAKLSCLHCMYFVYSCYQQNKQPYCFFVREMLFTLQCFEWRLGHPFQQCFRACICCWYDKLLRWDLCICLQTCLARTVNLLAKCGPFKQLNFQPMSVDFLVLSVFLVPFHDFTLAACLLPCSKVKNYRRDLYGANFIHLGSAIDCIIVSLVKFCQTTVKLW